MKLGGAAPAEVSGVEQLAGKSNYFIGNDPQKWRAGVTNYAKVRYKRVYPGIDLVYHGSQRQLEYDFVVDPGADPAAIRLAFEGAQRMRIDSAGDLVLNVADQEVRFRKPVIYQPETGGAAGRRLIPGGYVRRGASQAAFKVGSYDPTVPLIIDPVLVRSTFLGGSAADLGYGIAVDTSGFTYVTGSTSSVNFPVALCALCTLGGGTDAFVTVFNPAGTGFVYSTYLGGPKNDVGRGIATVNADTGGPGPAFVTGSTGGSFPLLSPIQPAYGGGTSDAFVAELNSAGAPVFSTYLGGAGEDIAYGIAVDTGLNVYITGSTNSKNFPRFKCLQCALNGGTDAFVTAIAAGGATLLYSTYLGGQANDVAYGISVDDDGDAGITGSTESPNFPISVTCPAPPGFQCANAGGTDAFITFLTFTPGPPPQAGPPTLSWSTYWGGTGNDIGYGISIGGFGVGWITGSTTNQTFPIKTCVQCAYGGGGTDAIVVNFETVPGIVFSDFLGGAGDDVGYAIARTGPGPAYLTGSTNSAGFPLAFCFQCALGGGTDAFVAEYKLGGLIFSSYLGGVDKQVGRAIAFDSQNASAYITGNTASASFPIVPPCAQCGYGGGPNDAFVAVVH
jgi:hypothetical protein